MRVRQGVAVKIGPFFLVAQQEAQIALQHSLGGPAASHFAAHHGLTFKEALKKRDELVARVHVVKSGSVKSPISCRQCENAPCARICPTGALQQDDGIVTMNAQICSGCQLCIMACPYGAISLESIGLPSATSETMAQKSMRSVAVRCDLCKDWMKREGKSVPACVEACPVHARSVVQIG